MNKTILFFISAVLASSLGFAHNSSHSGIEISYKLPESKISVVNKIGITEEFFDKLVLQKLTTLAYLGECNLNLEQSLELHKLNVSVHEDSSTEEITYIDFSLELDNVMVAYQLVRIEGGSDYDPVLHSDYSCCLLYTSPSPRDS